MTHEERLRRVRADLAGRARVFEDPAAYLDGVDDALELVRRLATRERAASTAQPTAEPRARSRESLS